MTEKHLTQSQLAERWGMAKGTLAAYRTQGKGPRYLKAGAKVLYRLQDVEAYEQERIYGSVSEFRANTAKEVQL
ncbi:MAG: helix-turn-helix domain-containing protein [Flavobacteriales bacterium]